MQSVHPYASTPKHRGSYWSSHERDMIIRRNRDAIRATSASIAKLKAAKGVIRLP